MNKNEEAFLRAIEISKRQFCSSTKSWLSNVSKLLSAVPHHAQGFGTEIRPRSPSRPPQNVFTYTPLENVAKARPRYNSPPTADQQRGILSPGRDMVYVSPERSATGLSANHFQPIKGHTRKSPTSDIRSPKRRKLPPPPPLDLTEMSPGSHLNSNVIDLQRDEASISPQSDIAVRGRGKDISQLKRDDKPNQDDHSRRSNPRSDEHENKLDPKSAGGESSRSEEKQLSDKEASEKEEEEAMSIAHVLTSLQEQGDKAAENNFI